MKFDDIDIAIFNVFLETDSLTSTEITKKVYDFEVPDRDLLVQKNTLIIKRLNKLYELGLLCYKKINRTKHYTINFDKITIGESNLKLNGKSVDMGIALIIDLDDNGYLVKFLDDCE